jgi:NADPH-dependent ferric siderophore reductase
MLTSAADPTIVLDGRPAYRPFPATVARLRTLSPHFTRVTFTSAAFDGFGTAGLDQRVKILFPIDGVGLSDIGADDPQPAPESEWYSRWRALDDAVRNPFRTYTVRAIRTVERELDIDFVTHGDGGPAARWLLAAAPGDSVVIVGPDRYSVHNRIGLDWHPGAADQVLLVGDETAAPAIAGILESLGAETTATALIEVPTAADALPLQAHAGVRVRWIARDDAAVGERLTGAVRGWIAENETLVAGARSPIAQPLDEVDVDHETLWESPEESAGDFYAWMAGESAMIKTLRRCLVTEHGIDRRRVAFMGYWRLGRSEMQ